MSTNRDSIRIKRGMSAELPESLPLGELAFCIDTRELWVGSGEGLALKRVTNTEITQHLEEWNLLYTEVDERFETKYHDVTTQFQEKFLDLSEQFSDKYADLNKQFSDKFEEICVQFSTKYNKLEEHYAQDLHDNKLSIQQNKKSIDLLKRDIGTTENIEDLKEINNQATETLEQLNVIKEELQNDVLVIRDIQDDLDKASIDYSGEHHDNLKDSMDANVDFIMGEFNTTTMTGETFTAQNTIQRHIKHAVIKGHTEVNYIQEDSSKDFVLPYEFEDSDSVLIPDTKTKGALNLKLKGKTLQNLMPNPTLRGSMVNGTKIQKLNEGHEEANVVDGLVTDAFMRGQTLVNLNRQTYPVSVWVDNPDSNTYYRDIETFRYDMFKPSTKYLFKVYGLPNVHKVTLQGTSRFFIDLNKRDYKFNEKGSLVLTTTGNIRDYIGQTFTPHFRRDEVNVLTQQDRDDFKMVILEYQEGMENWDIPYFEGMQSVENPILTTVGKNLCPTNSFEVTLTQPYLANELGTCICRNIKVKPSTKYTISFKVNKTETSMNREGVACFIHRTPIAEELSNSHYSSYTNIHEKIGQEVKGTMLSGSVITTQPDTEYITITSGGHSSEAGKTYSIYDLQLEEGETVTSFEPYMINTITPTEDVVLRKAGNYEDTLDWNTGEYIQRVGEIVLNGSENWKGLEQNDDYVKVSVSKYPLDMNVDVVSSDYVNLLCNKLVSARDLPDAMEQECISTALYSGYSLIINIAKSRLNEVSIQGIKNYLASENMVVLYPLETPIVKQVTFTSYGNWKKENLSGESSTTWTKDGNYYFTSIQPYTKRAFTSKYPVVVPKEHNPKNSCATYSGSGFIEFFDEERGTETWIEFVNKNPFDIWYALPTLQESNVTEPITFSNGYIQLSSSRENSLIPRLDFEVATNNTYYLDAIKPRTQYTMKCIEPNGTFTIAGESYDVVENGVFTSPTFPETYTSRYMVMSSTTPQQIMLFEGDKRNETVKYFKGIKSAYEGKNEIEISTTGTNLFNGEMTTWVSSSETTYKENNNSFVVGGEKAWQGGTFFLGANLQVGQEYTISFDVENISGDDTNFIIYAVAPYHVFSSNIKKVTKTFTVQSFQIANSFVICTHNGAGKIRITNLQIELGSVKTSYQAFNQTKSTIAINSPLRSLPNGVCDEIVVDRLKNKVRHIQRIGKIVIEGENVPSRWVLWDNNPAHVIGSYFYYQSSFGFPKPKSFACTLNNAPLVRDTGGHFSQVEGLRFVEYFTTSMDIDRLHAVEINKPKVNKSYVHSWFKKNNTEFYYELETPIITEKSYNPATITSTKNTSTYLNFTCDDYTIKPLFSCYDLEYEVLLKPNTTYSIISNSSLNEHSNTSIIFELGGKRVEATVKDLCTVVTTPQTLVDNKLRVKGAGIRMSGGLMVLEGDKTGMTFSYFSGIKSVEMPIVKTVSKNLSPISTYETFVREYATGYQGFDRVLAKNIELDGINYPHLSFTKQNEEGLPDHLGYISILTSAKKIPSIGYNGHNDAYTFCSTYPGIKYAHITMPNIGAGSSYIGKRVLLSNIQLELHQKTTFERHKSNTLKTPETLVLRKVGTYEDTLDLTTGEYIQHTYEEVINGESRLLLDGVTPYFHISNQYHNNLGVCDKLPVVNVSDIFNVSTIGIGIQHRGDYSRFYIRVSETNTQEEVLNFVTQNPITVVGALVNPIITKLELAWEDGKLFAYDGTTHFIVESDGLLPILEVDVPVNIVAELSRLRAENNQLTLERSTLKNDVSILQKHNQMLYNEVTQARHDNATLVKQLDKTNIDLEHAKTRMVRSVLNAEEKAKDHANKLNESITNDVLKANDLREIGDLELLSSDFELDFRLMEIEFALDIPMSFSTKGVGSMARTPYEMAKILILGGKYEREDMETKLKAYRERGKITVAEYDELVALMDANELA